MRELWRVLTWTAGMLVAVAVLGMPTAAGAFGTDDLHALALSTYGFSPAGNGQWTNLSGGWSYRSGGTNPGTCTNVSLPSGVILESITTYTNDTDAAGDITHQLLSINLATGIGTNVFFFSTSGTPGIERVQRPVSSPATIHNAENAYVYCIYHGAASTTNESAGATLWYRRQVSAAPPFPTFGDVPTDHPYFRFVQALVASGITAGCGGDNYCPDAPLTRAQMAVFLSKALGLHFAP